MRNTMTLAEAKYKLSSVIQDFDETYERIVMTKNGTDAAILLNADG